MTSISKTGTALLCASLTLAAAGAAQAQSQTAPTTDTGHVRLVQMLEVTLPEGLCEFDPALPANLIAKIQTRSDYEQLLMYMLNECPNLALPLLDAGTASLPEASAGHGDRAGDAIGDGVEPGTPGGTGTPGGGSDNSGEPPVDTDDDGDNGHGNSEGRNDPSNPGRGKN